MVNRLMPPPAGRIRALSMLALVILALSCSVARAQPQQVANASARPVTAPPSHEPGNGWTDPVTLLTIGLVVANIMLWLATMRLAREARIASGIAKESSDAAKESADAAVKAQMPILMPHVINVSRLLPPSDYESPTYRPIVEVRIVNHGRTPAMMKKFRCELVLLNAGDPPERPPWGDPPPPIDEAVIPGDSRLEKIQIGVNIPLKREITEAEARRVRARSTDPEQLRFFIFGYFIYDDVFGYQHVRGFCRKLFPNSVERQPTRGSERHYNYYYRIDRKTGLPSA